ncbi:hypothetical protein [Paenibacillus abyssi]|uniref:Uncharacterized protein n=1 Tax=Paenibacillus abyssi TaxID=1340531 RepID=A0A917CI14_9BACL|nr:hypothetical protein [Paenibacillus abyssi]GGF88116.1 hypothetical protein GCM10010916_01760 [Paenibacillus abyssi]
MSHVIDPKAGTHFTGKIFVKPHACDRAAEHFGIERSQAPMYVMDLLRKAALVDSDVLAEDGNRGRLYAYKRTAIVVAPQEDTVITIYPRDIAPEDLRETMAKVLKRALKAAQRTEARELKRLAIKKAELAVKRAEADLQRLTATRTVLIRKIDEEIAGINAEIARVDADIFAVKREKTTIAKGICAFI